MSGRQRKPLPGPRSGQPKSPCKLSRLHGLAPYALVLLLLSLPLSVLAEQPPEPQAKPSAPAGEFTTVPIGYLKQEVKLAIPLSRLNVEPEDYGIAGAEIALNDNNTTGKFTRQQFTLHLQRLRVSA